MNYQHNEKMMIRKQTESPVYFYYELNDADAKSAIDLYGTEERASEQCYIKAWDLLMPLENFMRIKHSEWDASAHLTNTSGLVIKMSECGTSATIGLMY
jgi:hypothetical protein